MQKAVSVIIPTFNRLASLKTLLQTLEKQTLPRDLFEIFVVVDGSTDGTQAFLEESGIPFEATGNRGPAGARNLGARRTTAPLLAFIDDDALADPEWLATACRARDEGRLRDAAEGEILSVGRQAPLSHGLSHSGPGGFLSCNLVITRECFERCGGFDERFTKPINEDFEFFVRLRKSAEITHLPGLKVYHPVYPLPFLKSLANAYAWARDRAVADRLLWKINPEGYRAVKFMPDAARTLRRQAFCYLLSEFEPGAFMRHPARGLMWALVCAARQLAFLRLWLSGHGE